MELTSLFKEFSTTESGALVVILSEIALSDGRMDSDELDVIAEVASLSGLSESELSRGVRLTPIAEAVAVLAGFPEEKKHACVVAMRWVMLAGETSSVEKENRFAFFRTLIGVSL